MEWYRQGQPEVIRELPVAVSHVFNRNPTCTGVGENVDLRGERWNIRNGLNGYTGRLDPLILDVLIWNNKSRERNYRLAIFDGTKCPVTGIPNFILASEQTNIYNSYKMPIFQ